jgi:hypothetical protein
MSHPDTPWTSTLAAGLVGSVAGILIGKFMGVSSGSGAPSTGMPAMGLLRDTITYIPHVLLLFGILADMVTYDLVYVIPTLVGLLSVVANFIMKYFWAGVSEVISTAMTALTAQGSTTVAPPAVAPASGSSGQAGGGKFFDSYDGCTIQGLGALASPYAPQTLVVTATIFSYLMLDLITNRGWKNATATIVIFATAYFGQAFTIGDCPVGDLQISKIARAIAALMEGLLFGGTGFMIVNTYFPERLPSATISPFPRKGKSELKANAAGALTDSDGNPYVCLPNGQCVPDLSTTESRTRFATLAAASLGTGTPAVPSSCPS